MMWWMHSGIEPLVMDVEPAPWNRARHHGAVGLVARALVLLISAAGLVVLVHASALGLPWFLAWSLVVFVLWIAGLIAVEEAANRCTAAIEARTNFAAAMVPSRSGWVKRQRSSGGHCTADVPDPHSSDDWPRRAIRLNCSTTLGVADVGTASSDPAGDHYRDQILRQLVERYLDGAMLPSGTANRLSVGKFHRLYRCVVQEGYGE